MATPTEQLQQLYVAYFSRPADVDGLNYWLNALANGGTIAQVSAAFAQQPEYTNVYGGKQPSEVIDTVYMNLFGRHAEQGGLDYWGGILQANPSLISQIVTAIVAGAKNPDGTPNADGIAYNDKVAAAGLFTDELKAVGNEAERIAYASGTKAVLDIAKNFISSVTDDASLATATAGLHATAQGMIPPPPVVNTSLTKGIDTLVGTVANDVFNAGSDSGNNDTLTSLDSIDGGAGTNTLNDVSVNNIAIPVTASVKNIQVANLTSAGTVTGDVSGWTGLTTATVVSTGGTTAAGLTAAATTAVSLTDVKLGAGVVTLTGGSSATVSASKVASTGAGTGEITVSGVTGAVAVTAAAAADAAAATIGAIKVTGGKTVSVTENLTASTVDVTKAVTGGDVTVTGGATTTTVTAQQTASAAATATTGAIVDGKVTINDANANSTTKAGTITTATVDGYKTGSSISSNALANLTLANSDAGAAFSVIANNAAAVAAPTTLNLTINNLAAGSTLDLENAANAANAVYKTVNITTGAKDSAVAIASSIATTLKVAGASVADLSASSLLSSGKLTTVTVTGAAGLTGDLSNASVTSVDASGTTGTVTTTINNATTYLASKGVDVLTLAAAAPTKAINLGTGDDTLVLQSLATTAGVTLDGGAGSNTVKTTFALASSGANASSELANFQKLVVSDLADFSGASKTIDATNFANISYVDLAAGTKSAAGNTLTIVTASGATIETNAADAAAGATTGKIVAAVANAAAGTADVITYKMNATAAGAAADFMGVDASNVETVNLVSTTKDTTAANIAADINKVALIDAAAKTVVVTGNVALDLTASGNTTGSTLTAVTKFDASAATGGVTVNLSGAAAGVTYLGGSGVDSVKVNSLANTVTTGGGHDVIDFTGVTSTATTFTTITDLAAGDTIKFAANLGNATGKLGAAITSPFGSDIFSLLNAATAGNATHNAAWFTLGGDTYIVQDNNAAGTFTAGSDLLIKLTGIHDLSNSTLTNGAAGLTIV